jgi:hypothetical protein
MLSVMWNPAPLLGAFNFFVSVTYRNKYSTLWMVSGMWILAPLLEDYITLLL